jgi:hypothetical protein
MGPTVIDKGRPIESMISSLRDHTRTFDSGVRARSNSRRTLPAEGINRLAAKLQQEMEVPFCGQSASLVSSR